MTKVSFFLRYQILLFFQSILEGFKGLFFWQVWLAVIIYVILNFGFLFTVAAIVGENESVPRMTIAYWFRMIGGAVFHGILMGVMVAFLQPVFWEQSSTTPITEIITYFLPIVKAGGFAIVLVLLLSFIPFLGDLIAYSSAIKTFLVGAIIFRFFTEPLLDIFVVSNHNIGNVFPGILESIGYIIIAGVLGYLITQITVGLAWLVMRLRDKGYAESMLLIVVPSISIFAAIITLLMYTSYVRLSISTIIDGAIKKTEMFQSKEGMKNQLKSLEKYRNSVVPNKYPQLLKYLSSNSEFTVNYISQRGEPNKIYVSMNESGYVIFETNTFVSYSPDKFKSTEFEAKVIMVDQNQDSNIDEFTFIEPNGRKQHIVKPTDKGLLILWDLTVANTISYSTCCPD